MNNMFNFICLPFKIETVDKQLLEEYLSQWELEKIKNSVDKRKFEFLYGRICAKYAYSLLCKSKIFDNRLCIYNDCFGAPFLEDGNYYVSITHESDLAAAVVTERSHLCIGIDVQKASEKNTKIIYDNLSDNEKGLFEQQATLQVQYGRNFLITAIWVAKEAISKLLGYGFLIYDALEVSNFYNRNDHLIVKFKMFNNFSIIIEPYKEYLFGFAVHDKELNLYGESMFTITETQINTLLI